VRRLQGLTIQEAESLVQAELNRYVIDPEVEAILTAQRPVQVTVAGEVVTPGLYALPSPQLAVAIASAGGTTRLADLRSVRIRRYLDNGSVVERNVDIYTQLRETNSIPEVRLENGDTVIITSLDGLDVEGYDRTLIARTTLAQQQITIRVLDYSAGTGGTRGGSTLRNITLPNGSRFLDALTTIAPNLDRADMGDIALIRFDPIQGKAVAQEINGRHALRGDMAENPPVEHNDVIVVGRNLIARVTYALNTFTQPFRDILGFILFFDSLADSADNLFRPSGNDDDN
jgi:polysaccharide export outer membrane protein